MKKKNILIICLLFSCIFILSACGKDKNETSVKLKTKNYNNIPISSENPEEDVASYLLENVDVECSEEELNDYIKELEAYYINYSSYFGVDLDTYIKDYLGKTREDFDKEARESAIEYVKTKAILLKIAKKEKIEFTDEDYEKYLEKMFEDTSYNSLDDFKLNIKDTGQEENMKESAYLNKILEYVVDLNTKKEK